MVYQVLAEIIISINVDIVAPII